MTRRDVEMALIQMGKAMKTILSAYAPNANQADISLIKGMIIVRAHEWNSDDDDFAERNILDATLYPDGVLRLGSDYITPKEGVG